MSRSKGKHLTRQNREVIEAGIRSHDSARTIAKRIDVSPSTVTREVKAHRTIRKKKISIKEKTSLRCAKYNTCQLSAHACSKCSTKFTTCKHCKTRSCIATCSEFELRMCPTTQKWPYVCPEICPKRAHCGFPKCSYDAADADAAYRKTLSTSRAGLCITQAELDSMNDVVVPLAKQGQSFEAIWLTHADKLPICLRSAYKYQEAGVLGLTSIDMPRKARLLPRKKPEQRDTRHCRVDRTNHTYDDFCRLSVQDQVRVVQADSVEGFVYNKTDILSLCIVSTTLQLYLKKTHADSSSVVAWFDVIEHVLGSPVEFEKIFGIMLCDRGIEFDDWEGMERSCLIEGVRRCQVFYCDKMNANQKSQAERTHEQLRRILPKGRSNFDCLSVFDVSVCASHVNSYPLARWSGKCPLEVACGLVPKHLLDELGIERIPADEVILKPYLMAHAVEQ